MKLIYLLSLLSLISCVPDKETSQLSYFEVDKAAYKKFINEKSLPTEPDLALDKSIINNDYPIEIYAADQSASQVILKFRDRNGPQIVKMTNENID